MAAGSPGNVWIAGQYFDTAKDASEPFIAHFNGKTWSPGKVPANGAEFFGLTVIRTVNGPTAGIILSWNGSAWTKVRVPKAGATEELYSASAALGSTLTWAFGRSTSSGGVVSNLTLCNG